MPDDLHSQNTAVLNKNPGPSNLKLSYSDSQHCVPLSQGSQQRNSCWGHSPVKRDAKNCMKELARRVKHTWRTMQWVHYKSWTKVVGATTSKPVSARILSCNLSCNGFWSHGMVLFCSFERCLCVAKPLLDAECFQLLQNKLIKTWCGFTWHDFGQDSQSDLATQQLWLKLLSGDILPSTHLDHISILKRVHVRLVDWVIWIAFCDYRLIEDGNVLQGKFGCLL